MEPNNNKKSLYKSPVKISFYFLFAGWCIIILGMIIWSREGIYSETIKLAQREAYKGYEKDVMFRAWATMHGGVYVPINDETPPNPYLANVPERDITTPSGNKLTLMNPAYITRQVHELSYKKSEIKGHITSLNPIRKENAPDKWEINALKAFAKGTKEVSGFDTLDNVKHFRYMAPLITNEGCLKCHAAQGYKIGDIRGGISSSVPWESYEASIKNQTSVVHIGYGILWFIGFAGLFMVKQKFVIYIARRDQDEQEMRKLNEELTAAKEKLEKINSEKDNFFSIISHDLRSPFQGFLGLTADMASNIQNFSQAELSEISNEMNKSANNLFKLLKNLLEWAQVQNGTISYTPKEQLLLPIAVQGVESMELRASQKSITVVNAIPDSIPVYADEKMIDTIFRNLLSNAVKFTSTNGKITLSAKEIEDNMAEISISDTGTGISEMEIDNLFRLDKKVSHKGTQGEESSGLGLLLCKEFIEKHGGKIRATSKLGHGSTFYFTVPRS